MSSLGYVFEVVKPVQDQNISDGYIHLGYMNVWFKSKLEAIEYYDAWNPQMRSMKQCFDISECDPTTGLTYIIRENFNVRGTIAPFGGQNDIPIRVEQPRKFLYKRKRQLSRPTDSPGVMQDWGFFESGEK